jgi:hypothetical protein
MADQAGDGEGGSSKQAPRSSARYIIFVGVAFAALIAVATINTFRNPPTGLLGVNADVKGRALPEFALPDVRSSLVGDANIFQDDCASSQNPCPPGDVRASACRVHIKGAIRVCDFFDRPLAISFWFTRGASCLPAQDAFERVARRYGDRVGFLSIDVRDDRDDVRRVAAERHWTVPVGWDRDGAVSDLYRVGGCPTVAFAFPGGVFAAAHASVGELTVPKLTADIRTLLADTRRRALASR